MLATDSIDPLVKHFLFLTDSIDHRFEKRKKFSIESNHRLKIFFSSKDHRSNWCFLQLIDYRYRSNRCFFRHRCPTMLLCNTYSFVPLPFCNVSLCAPLDLRLAHCHQWRWCPVWLQRTANLYGRGCSASTSLAKYCKLVPCYKFPVVGKLLLKSSWVTLLQLLVKVTRYF
jgi:hypothetical protein